MTGVQTCALPISIRSAHRIIVVDDNHILEEGSHEELLAKGGEYARLYNAQKRVV